MRALTQCLQQQQQQQQPINTSINNVVHHQFYLAPGRGTGYCFRAISLFLCQQHYEKTAGPICMKFPGKVWSDHGTT